MKYFVSEVYGMTVRHVWEVEAESAAEATERYLDGEPVSRHIRCDNLRAADESDLEATTEMPEKTGIQIDYIDN